MDLCAIDSPTGVVPNCDEGVEPVHEGEVLYFF